MYVCSLHEKQCPCRLCSIAHVTVTWGCALQVTVSTSNSCCCPLQLFRVVAHWVALRSWSLVRLNTSLERSVELPLASSTKRKFFRGLITPKLQLQEKQHAHLLGGLPLARSWSLALRARWSPCTDAHLFLFWLPTVPAVSSERRLILLVSCQSCACLNRSLLRVMSRQVPCCHCSAVSLERRAALCIRCRCLARLVSASVTSSFGNTKGKLFTKFKKSNGEHLFDLLHAAGQYRQRMRSQHLFRSRFASSEAYARTVARASIDLVVQRRETRAADKLRTNNKHYCF